MTVENINFQIMKNYLNSVGAEIDELVNASAIQPSNFTEANQLIRYLSAGLQKMQRDWDTCILFLDLGEEDENEVSM